jgi:2-desacetyl-2-hydroxyethyl bacteriochlorophyllide A dehydrogenase
MKSTINTESWETDGSRIGRALWTIAPRFCELRDEPLEPLKAGSALVVTRVSGISGGTEQLVFAGKIPPSEYARMRAPFQAGSFPFPVKYGYAAVGVVEAGPDAWLGARVFVLHPHQDRFVVPVAALTRIDDAIPTERAVLSANMETALNAVWDAGLLPGERVAIVGAGVVGSLVAAIASRIPGVDLTLFDSRREVARRATTFGARFVHVDGDKARAAAKGDFDCVFHATGQTDGLALALGLAGMEARIIELSWYGDATVTLALGEAFHSRRLRIISSQVGMVARDMRSRFDHKRRMTVAQRLLDDDRLDVLIGARVDFPDLPAKIGAILGQRGGLCPLVFYPQTP